MFCGVDNLQCLCKGCHDAKTAEEKVERQKFRLQRKRDAFKRKTKILTKEDLKVKYKDEEFVTRDMFKKSTMPDELWDLYGRVVYQDGDVEIVLKEQWRGY